MVSVLVPAYNVERYIAEAVESALAQTYPAVEVVVVNDGSTDGTADALLPYRDRVVYVEQENRGLAGARNTAIGASSGEYLALLDGDDVWLPERLERCVPILEARPEIGMVGTDAYLIEETTKTTKRTYGTRKKYPFPAREEDQLATIALRNFLFVSVLFRRSLVDRFGGFDESLRRAEDYELWMRFLIAGARAAFVNEPLGYYRIRAGSLSAAAREQWAAHLTVLERHLPELWPLGIEGHPRDEYEIGEHLAARRDRRGAARFFAHAVRGPGNSLTTRLRYASGAALHLVGGGRGRRGRTGQPG